MRAIAVTNQKGGSGKTTTAVNLSAALAERQQRVLLVDLDPQGSASTWLGVPLDAGRGLLDAYTSNSRNTSIASLVASTSFAGLDVLPASPWLATAEKTTADLSGAEGRLREVFGQLPRRWDYLLVDCPPTLGFLALSALVACRELMIPVEAHVMALGGLAALLQTVDRVREKLNPALTLAGILACRVDTRTNLSRDVVARLRERFGSQVFAAVVRENVRLAEAPSFQQPITTYAPTSAGAEDYRAVAVELMKRGRGRLTMR